MRTRLANGLEMEVFGGPALGPGMIRADQETIRAALERFDVGIDWPTARPLLLPMLPRLRPFPVAIPDLVSTIVSPGILINFGLDLGPALSYVGAFFLDNWGIDRGTLTATALDNVRRLARGCDAGLVVRSTIDGTPVDAFQSGAGISSTLLLTPELLPDFFGPGPHLLAPMRDVILALPATVDREPPPRGFPARARSDRPRAARARRRLRMSD